MNDCEHSYGVRAIQGDSRFLCKECNERFVGHPDVIRRKKELDQAIAQEIADERQRAIENGWKIGTHEENAKVLIDTLFPNDQDIQQRMKDRPLGRRHMKQLAKFLTSKS